jgi:hypothetical protein
VADSFKRAKQPTGFKKGVYFLFFLCVYQCLNNYSAPPPPRPRSTQWTWILMWYIRYGMYLLIINMISTEKETMGHDRCFGRRRRQWFYGHQRQLRALPQDLGIDGRTVLKWLLRK